MAAYRENFSFVVLFKRTIVARRKNNSYRNESTEIVYKLNDVMSIEHKIRTVSYIKKNQPVISTPITSLFCIFCKTIFGITQAQASTAFLAENSTLTCFA